MARLGLGFTIGFVVPLILLAVNVVFGYGGILITVALLVWLSTAILLSPTPEEER